jgi:CheY-like chemotaxis protein
MSGFASPEEVERALGAGFDRHLAKPLEATELIAVVRDAARERAR